jgi:hypothetical protein
MVIEIYTIKRTKFHIRLLIGFFVQFEADYEKTIYK